MLQSGNAPWLLFMSSRKQADLYFGTPSGRVGLTQWKKLDEAMAAGYRYAVKRLEEAGPEMLVKLGAEPAATEPLETSRAAATG